MSDLEVVEIMETAGDGQENPVQDRKSMWKLLKQQKKEAKRIKREEEYLANLRKPKDTKVVLADKSFIEKLRNQNVPSRAKRAPGFLAQDFPALSAKSPPKSPQKSKEPTADSPVADRALTVVPETKKGVEPGNNCGDLSSTGAIAVRDISPEPASDGERINPISTAPPEVKKRTRRKDPLVLYSHDLISKTPKKEKRHEPVSRRHKPEVVLCGNMLDSSNPVRKRGKHREIKKLKLSKLKLAIIKDRILKQKEENNSTGAHLMDPKQLKIDIDEYLSNLTKNKLELAEKHQKRTEENKTEQIIPGEIPPESEEKNVKKKPTKYRKYCDNAYSEDLDESVKHLIQGIVYLQDRAFNRDPIKAKVKQKHVVGFREVKKYLMLTKVKMVVVAPDLEAKDAVCSVVEDLKKATSLQNVPCVFALSRRLLGTVAKKSVPVSAFGIMDYDGVEDRFAAVKEKLKEAQDKYKQDSPEVGNTNGKASEVTAVEEKIQDVSINKVVSARKENEPASHKQKKKTKHKQQLDEAHTNVISARKENEPASHKQKKKTKHKQQLDEVHTNVPVNKRSIDTQDNV